MPTRKRNWLIAGAVVATLALLQSTLMIPVALVLLGRWVYLDASARRIRNPPMWAVIVPIGWVVMLPMYLATRPLAAGEIRVGGTWCNVMQAFAATYAVGTPLLLLRYVRFALFGLAWTAMTGGLNVLKTSLEVVGVLGLIASPALLALGAGRLLRTSATEVGPTGPLATKTPSPGV